MIEIFSGINFEAITNKKVNSRIKKMIHFSVSPKTDT